MTELSVQLRQETAAVRFSASRFGTRRTLGREQRNKAAAPFDAEGKFLSASKCLIDTTCKQYRAVTSAMAAAEQHWRLSTTPYPDRGVRLIRRSRIEGFNVEMSAKRADIDAGVSALEEVYQELIDKARIGLGELFNASDYPQTLVGSFGIAWDYPSVEPPDYLKQLSPDIYAAETEKIKARFSEAASMTQAAFAKEFGELVSNLADKLRPQDVGSRKHLHATAIDKFADFFKRFDDLKIGSDNELEKLIADAKQVLGNADADAIRANDSLRISLGAAFRSIKESTDSLVQVRSRVFNLENE